MKNFDEQLDEQIRGTSPPGVLMLLIILTMAVFLIGVFTAGIYLLLYVL